MRKAKRVIWGLILIVLGVTFALSALDIVKVDIFFDGWWTLFIILPCTVSFFTEGNKFGNFIGIALGVFWLLDCQDIIPDGVFWKLFVPVIVVLIGLRMVFSALFGKKRKMIVEVKKNGKDVKHGCAVFSGCDMNYNGQNFDGADLVAVFGGVDCDISGAIIENDCSINLFVVFGGIDIIVPENINVKFNSTCIFGGTSNKKDSVEGAPTVYINGVCLFGGVEVKEKEEEKEEKED